MVVAALIVVALLLYLIIPSTSSKDNKESLERLDAISQRLSDIGLRMEVLDAEIAEREYEKDNLISEQTKLNDEASVIFMSMMTPEMLTPKESTWVVACFGCSHYDADTNSCIEWDKRSRRCEANFPTDTLEEWNEDWWEPGKLTEDWTNQVMPDVTWADSHQRFKDLAIAYGLDPSKIWEVENHYGITEGVVLCITIAETSWGKFGAGNWNIWNVGNNDRGDRVSFALADTGLEKIGQTLTNQFLWNKKTLWCLSNWHHCEEPTDNGKRYATSSPETSWAWEPNMVACLDTIYGQWTTDPSTFNIRR